MRHHDNFADAAARRRRFSLVSLSNTHDARVEPMPDATTLLALGLVLASAGGHASWNLLLKRAQRQEVFVWWLSAFATAALLPIAVIIALRTSLDIVGLWYVTGSALVHICYFLFLGRSLARSDLSLVYPIARGFGPGLAPILAALTLGETVSIPGWAGIGCIVAGIYIMAWWGRVQLRWSLPDFSRLRHQNAAGIGYALLTGLCIALYTIVDKQGVAYISPFLYLYLMTAGVAAGMLPYIIRNHGWRAIGGEWRTEPWAIPAASGLVYLAYGLALSALRISEVSYVAPAREVGMLFALALGAVVLRERITRGRLAGAALIAAGLAVITLFR